MPDSKTYTDKKAFFDSMLTIFGRKPVLEALTLDDLQPYRLHLAEDNRPSEIMNNILQRAKQQNIEVKYHDRQALSRLSGNKRQDQGVVLDIQAPRYQPISALQFETMRNQACGDLIALENVTNPQNIGMIIRSVGASPCAGIIIPQQGCAKIDAMVIKASAGTALKVPIYHMQSAYAGLKMLKQGGFRIIGLSSQGTTGLAEIDQQLPSVFVMGNETRGLSKKMADLCHQLVHIPLCNQVESLNVSVAASIVAFRSIF